MKKILIYSTAVLAVGAVSACVRETTFSQEAAQDTVNAINLGVRCTAAPKVKADDEETATDYNENSVYYIDWFIYNENETSADALLHKRVTYADAIKPVDEETAKEYLQTITLDDLVKDGSLTDGYGYVYVIANLPKTYTHDPQKGIMNGETEIGTTLEALKAISLDATFVEMDANSIEGKIVTDHHFVMATAEPQKFTLEERNPSEILAPLRRLAVKVRLDLNISDYVIQSEILEGQTDPTPVRVWEPDYNHAQIYMLWVDSHATLGGTPEQYTEATSTDSGNTACFFNTPRYANYFTESDWGRSSGSVNESLVGVTASKPVANYELMYRVEPREGVEKDIVTYNGLKYAKDGGRTDVDYYYYTESQGEITILTPAGTTADGALKVREYANNPVTRDFYPVQSVPLYTYPIKWSNRDAHAPFIKIILPWNSYKYDATKTTDHFKGALERSNVENYYKVMLPKIDYPAADGSGTESVYELRSNYFVDISLDLSVLGSEADDVPVDVFGTYYVVGWNDPVPMGGDLQAGKYLSVSSTSYEMYGNTLEIPVVSSNELKIVDVTAKYSTFNPEGTADLAKSEYTITSPDRTKVIVSHEVESDLDKLRSQDISPITYTFVIQHSGDKSYTTNTVTVTQYPSLYISSRTNSNWTTTGNQYNSNYGYVYINNAQTRTRTEQKAVEDSPYNWRYISGITSRTGSNANPNTYLITTKTIDPSLGFVLGDTRESAINNLVESNSTKFSNAIALFGDSPRNLSYYYPTDETDRTEVMVAPSFRIASSYGKVGYALYRNDARLRCAAYQEDGYPAGRWRLPTKAELQYITTLSAAGLIPQLFNDLATSESSIYMSAHGVITIDNGVVKDATSDYGFVRCVYDEWYWGDERVNNTTFTWGDKER